MMGESPPNEWYLDLVRNCNQFSTEHKKTELKLEYIKLNVHDQPISNLWATIAVVGYIFPFYKENIITTDVSNAFVFTKILEYCVH